MAQQDQQVRQVPFDTLAPDERAAAFARWEEVDRANTARLREIVDDIGWPTRSLVGAEAAHAAFLLVQHADADPQFQARCLPMLSEAARSGDVSPRDVAYLTDRVRVKQGRPQLYGTQYGAQQDATGNVVVGPDGQVVYLLPVVEDIDRLDERRAEVGLGPWAEYEKTMAPRQGRQPAARPTPSPR